MYNADKIFVYSKIPHSNCCDDKNVILNNLFGNELTSSTIGFEFALELNLELNWNLFILCSVFIFKFPDMLEVVL